MFVTAELLNYLDEMWHKKLNVNVFNYFVR